MSFIPTNELNAPFIEPIAPFDTRFEFLLTWRFRGHLQPERSQIRIRNLETGGNLFGQDQDGHINPSIASEFTIHPSIWGETRPNNHPWQPHEHARGNGHHYTVEVRVQFESGLWSPWSNRVQFLTLTRPNLQLLSVTENLEIHNHTVDFKATYSQAQNEPLRRFGFSLLDQNMQLIQQFPNQPAPIEQEDTPGGANISGGWGDTFTRLTQAIGRFDKNRSYFIRLDVETFNGMRWSATRFFTSHYLEPTTEGVVDVHPVEEEGFIRVSARLEQIRGQAVVRGSRAIAMLENEPWKPNIEDKTSNEQIIELRKRAVESITQNEHIVFLPQQNPEWIVIPPSNKIIVRRITFGAAMVMHGQFVGGRCINGETIMVIQTPEERGPVETFTFKHYFHNGRRRIVCTKDNNTGHKAMYTSNSISMEENHAWHLNMKFDWQRMSLRIHNLEQEVPI